MPRKRLTEILPWLLPLRKRQRLFCFYLKKKLDPNHYARNQSENRLPCEVFSAGSEMLNPATGFDERYQHGKIYNLKLAAKVLDGLVINPGESFSFWQAVRHADRYTPYKDGLAVVNGKLTTVYGGGLCQLSGLLCWVFLHTPMVITERHGHKEKDFPDPPGDMPCGVDATVSEGWLDLCVKNETDTAYQIAITFDGTKITGAVYAEKAMPVRYEITNKNLTYRREGTGIFEEVDVIRRVLDKQDGQIIEEKKLYHSRSQINYPLPDGTAILQGGNKNAG